MESGSTSNNDQNKADNNSNIVRIDTSNQYQKNTGFIPNPHYEKHQNIGSDQSYQNPQKFIKTDENGPGIPNSMHMVQQNFSTSMQAPNMLNYGMGVGANMNNLVDPRLQNQNFGDFKHGAKNENQPDMNTMQVPSYAPQHGQRQGLNESKENEESDEAFSDDPKSRTSASSRVNFSKLTAEEKERRCHNMSKEVKQLRRKIRNMEERLARSNITGDYGSYSTGNDPSDNSISKRAKDKLRNHRGFELIDQKDLIDNL